MVSIFVMIFWIYFEDIKLDYLLGYIVVFSIGTKEQKLCPNKLKARVWVAKQNFEILNFEFFSHILYFFYMESFHSFHLNKWCESYGHSCFSSDLSISFWKNNLYDSFLNAIFTTFQKNKFQMVYFSCLNNLTIGNSAF